MQCGCIVHAIARHGHHFAAGLQGLYQAQFLRRCDAGTDAHLPQALAQGGIVQTGQFVAREHIAIEALTLQTGLSGDHARGGWVVAGDHDHADAGAVALRNRFLNVRTQRVGQADQAQPLEIQIVRTARKIGARQWSTGHTQHAQAQAGELVGGGQPLLAIGIAEMAKRHHGLGRAFG